MQNIPPLASLDNFFELPFRDLIGELFLTILLLLYASKSGVRQTHVGRKLCDSARALQCMPGSCFLRYTSVE